MVRNTFFRKGFATSKRIPWRYVLPVANTAVAWALLFIAAQQRRRAGFVSAWDYVPPAKQIAYMINFPAVLAWSAIQQLLPYERPIRDVGFLVSTFTFWYLIGAGAFRRALIGARRHRLSRLLIYACATVGTAAVGSAAVASWRHPTEASGGLLWCAYFTWSMGINMFRRSTERG